MYCVFIVNPHIARLNPLLLSPYSSVFYKLAVGGRKPSAVSMSRESEFPPTVFDILKVCRCADLQGCKCARAGFSSNFFHPLSQRAVGMKNSNQRSEEWRSAVSSQQSARERGRDREIAPTVSNLECSNLLRLRFSPFRSRRFQQLGQSSPDRNDQQG